MFKALKKDATTRASLGRKLMRELDDKELEVVAGGGCGGQYSYPPLNPVMCDWDH